MKLAAISTYKVRSTSKWVEVRVVTPVDGGTEIVYRKSWRKWDVNAGKREARQWLRGNGYQQATMRQVRDV